MEELKFKALYPPSTFYSENKFPEAIVQRLVDGATSTPKFNKCLLFSPFLYNLAGTWQCRLPELIVPLFSLLVWFRHNFRVGFRPVFG